MAKSKDLFDDSTMTFGEHLEVLRIHLWKAIIGLGICVILALFFGNSIIAVIRSPIDAALQRHGAEVSGIEDVGQVDLWEEIKGFFSGDDEPEPEPEEPEFSKFITVKIAAHDLAKVLHDSNPNFYPAPSEDAKQNDDTGAEEGGKLSLTIEAPEFAQLQQVRDQISKPVTLNVPEAFLTFLKVSFVAGFVLASPWVFVQVWFFVAAGLYPHERKYVYIFLPLSLGLFITGAAFCFVVVFPFVLDFMLGFNRMMGVHPQIRLSEWITFAIMLPLMFGLSFQLPLVMLFLERIGIFEMESYRSSRRMAILVISVISMLMTPADPISMLLMMFPLIGLYELGILLCGFNPPRRSPFEAEAAD